MSQVIPITNGRVVWFQPNGLPDIAHADSVRPLAAHVCHVWNDHLVNLLVIDSNGITHPVTSVEFIQPGEPKPDGTPFAHWMPYQVGQAAKHDEAAKNAPTAPA